MGFLDSIGSALGGVVSGVGHAVSDVVGGAVHGVESAVGGVVKGVEDTVGSIIQNPLNIFNPFTVLKGAEDVFGGVANGVGDVAGGVFHGVSDLAGGLFHGVEGVIGGVGNAAANAVGGNSSASSSSAGESVYDKIFDALAKLQGSLNDKANQLGDLDPSKTADSSKMQKLTFDIQQIQDQMSQMTTAATNLLKTQNDTEMSEIRNFA